MRGHGARRHEPGTLGHAVGLGKAAIERRDAERTANDRPLSPFAARPRASLEVESQRGSKQIIMRPGQNRRVRGRSRSKGPNPLTRSYESNGPDVKVRGTAQHIADKYAQLARDAQSSGDPVAAENYYQHAEHYYRIIAGAQEQFRQQFGGYGQRPFDDDGEDGDEEAGPNGFPYQGGERPAGAPNGENADFGNQPQPYEGRKDDRSQPFEGRRDDRSQAPDGRRNDRPPPFDGRRDDRSQRFDRGERFGADRSGERYGRDRNDRPGSRPPERNERYERYDRQDNRQDSGADRRERDDRSDRGPRPEPGRPEPGPERFGRGEQGTQRPPEVPRENRAEARGDGPRPERRREETEEPAGLPAFLTNPVRAPIAVEEAAVEASPALAEAAGESEAAEGEGNGRTRTRRRRTRYKGPEENGAPEGAAPAEDPTPAE